MRTFVLIGALTALLQPTPLLSGAETRQARPKLTPEQREARKYRHFGGHVLQPVETKEVVLLDCRGETDGDGLSRVAAEMSSLLSIPVRTGKAENAGCTLRVVSGDGTSPLLVMPEKPEARVDVNALSADKPSPAVLEARIEKELWRGLVYALGGGNTYFPKCVMKPVASLSELDALPARAACPDAYARALEGATKFKIRPARRVTYRQAVKEGWAPPPTNDVQKAVWDEVKKQKGAGK